MRKLLLPLLALLSVSAHAEVWQARYGVAETFNFKLYNADGTLDVDEADGGTEVSVSCNEGAETTATNDFVDEGTFYSIALTSGEMSCERIAVVIAATTTEVFFIQTNSNASAMTPANDANLVNIAGSAVSTSTAQLGVNVVNAAGTAWGSGAITAASIATDAITAAKIAADAIAASEIAADAIGAAEIANAAIDAATFASAAIDATAIATDAIGAAELATDAIGAAELAADAVGASEVAADAIGASELATGAITTAEFAAGAIDATAIATDAIGAAEIAANAIAAAEVADGAIDEATFATTAGSFDALGIIDQGTAQAATSATLQLRSAAAFADDEVIGATCVITGGSAGVGQARTISDYVSSTDTATVETWTTTPTGTITYQCFGTAASTGGGGDATEAKQDTILANLATVDTNVDAILVDTAEIGAAGAGLTNINLPNQTMDIVGNITGNLSGSVGSVTGAVGSVTGAVASVTGAVGSVTGNVGGNVTGSVGSVASGGITATSIATDAIGAAEIAADAGTELGTATWATTTRLLTAGTNIALAKGTGVTGFNDLSAAQVNSEVDTALSDIFLDRLFAVDYDPTAEPGVATALLNELIQSDAGVSQFTANALETAPSGSSITDWTADERTAMRAILGVPGSGTTPDDPTTGILDTTRDAVAGVQSDTNDIQTRVPAALVSGRMDSSTGAMAANVMTAAAAATDFTTEVQSGLATTSALTSLDTKIGTPAGASVSADNAAIKADTAATLVDTAEIGVAGAGLTAVDDAVLAAIAALNNLSAAQLRDLVIEDQGGGVSLGCALAVLLAYSSGDVVTTGANSTYEDPSGTETRTTGTVASAGNRTATITCPTY